MCQSKCGHRHSSGFRKRPTHTSASISEDVPGDDDTDDDSDAVPSNDMCVENREGESELMQAVRHNHCDRIQQLVRSGCDCNAVYKTAGAPCMVHVHRESFRKTLQMMGYAPLHVAAIHSSLRTIKCLLAMGSEVNARDKHERTALQLACAVNRLQVAQLLVESGAEVNTQSISGKSPLIEAVVNVNLDLTRLLLGSGADVDLTDIKHTSPLCAVISAMTDRTCNQTAALAIVQSLLDAGCSVDYTNPAGASALMLASGLRIKSVIPMLISAGADINLADRKGQTPFSMAIEGQRSLTTVKLLMKYGAATDQPDTKGQTPLSKVVKFGAVAILRLLLSTDAVPHAYHVLTAPRIVQLRQYLPEFDSWLQEEFYKPRSLLRLCREVVRREMSPHNLRKVDCLGLPRTLNDYVLGATD